MRRFNILFSVFLALSPGFGFSCLGDEPDDYDQYYQIHVPPFADMIIDRVRGDIKRDIMKKKDSESDAEYAIRKRIAENMRDTLTSAIRELDHVRLGLQLDHPQKRIYLDLSATAIEHADLARRLNEVRQLKTSFAGTQQADATLAAHWVGRASKQKAQAAAQIFRLIREIDLKKIDDAAVRDLAGVVFDVLESTAESSRFDGGLSLVLKADHVTLVAGGFVADDGRLEGVFRQVAGYVRDNHADAAKVELDAEQFEDVSLHHVALSAPAEGADRKNFLRMFGDDLDIVVAFQPEAVFVAAGKDATTAIKPAIQQSAAPVVPESPLEFSVALKPIADFIAETGQGPEAGFTSMISGILGRAEGRDRILLRATSVDRGIVIRGEMEQGLLELMSTVLPELRKPLLGQE